jgi:hypothetical protein
VFTGALPGCGTTAVAAELPELEPDAFVPVTTTRSVEPMSLLATVYDADIAPAIGTQL